MQGVQLLTYFHQLYMLASGGLAWRPEPSRGFGSHARREHDTWMQTGLLLSRPELDSGRRCIAIALEMHA
jgi:hypothetical protein